MNNKEQNTKSNNNKKQFINIKKIPFTNNFVNGIFLDKKFLFMKIFLVNY